MKQDNKTAIHKEKDDSQLQEQYVEILGDTVSPAHVILSTIISVILGLGGFLIGQKLFPKVADESMVLSYSLLTGIGGCVLAFVLSSVLFKPKRILTEKEITMDHAREIVNELQVDMEEEKQVMENDPVIRKEMEELKIKDVFMPSNEGGKK